MKVVLRPFARSAIEERFGADVTAGVKAALTHYTRRLRSAQKPVGVPGFLDTAPAAPGSELDLPVEAEVEQALTREMREREITIEQLTAHAVFVYLADLD